MEFKRKKRMTSDSFEHIDIKIEKRIKSSFSGIAQTLINITLYLGAFFLFFRDNLQYMGMFIIFMAVSVLAQLIIRFGKAIRVSNKKPYLQFMTKSKEYKLYLDGIEEEIKSIKCNYQSHLIENYFAPSKFIAMVNSHDKMLWAKLPNHKDFLWLNIGESDLEIPLTVTYPPMTYNESDRLLKNFKSNIDNIIFKSTEKAPSLINLTVNKTISISCANESKEILTETINSYIIDIATMHSPDEVSIAVAFNDSSDLYWTRFLPHVWNGDFRMIDNGTSDIDEFTTNVMKISSKIKKHLVFFVDIKQVINSATYANLNTLDLPSNISIIFFSDEELVPSRVSKSIEIITKDKFSYGLVDSKKLNIHPTSENTASYVAKALFNTKLIDNKEISSVSIPTYYTFLEMYEQSEKRMYANKDENANICENFEVQVGISSDKKIGTINLSEHVDGPHCLVTGTTGSGKSEFLQTYLLSACLKYGPEYFSFVIIDFKGGTVSDKVREFPHFAGDFVNEDTVTKRHISRIITMLDAEIKYRTKMLKSYECNKLHEYHIKFSKGEISTPLPLLLVVVDEVAVFFSEDSESSKKIERLATVGRSFGIHLMLATQSKTGTIHSQIKTNINGHIEFFTEDEVKKNVIKAKGRAHVYSRAKMNEEYQVAISATTDINELTLDFIKLDGTSRIYKEKSLSTQFEIFSNEIFNRYDDILELGQVRQVLSQTLEQHYDNLIILKNSTLTLKAITDNVNGAHAFDRETKSAIVGVADNIYESKRNLFRLSIFASNIFIFGLQNTGKTELIKCFITSVTDKNVGLTPSEIGIYIVTKNINEYKSYHFPHVADVLSVENIYYLLLNLTEQLNNRRMQGAHNEFTPILAIFDGCYSEIINDNELKAMFSEIVRESIKYEITIVVTANQKETFGNLELKNFEQIISFYMGDDFDYSTILHIDNIKKIPNIPGRFLATPTKESEFNKTLEVQGSLAYDDLDEEIQLLAHNYRMIWGNKSTPSKTKIMPDKIAFEIIEKHSNLIPLGLARNLSTSYWNLSLSNTLYISYMLEQDRNGITSYLIKYFTKLGYSIVLVESSDGCFANCTKNSGITIINFESDTIKQSKKLREVYGNVVGKALFVINDLARFSTESETMSIIREKIDNDDLSYFVFSDMPQQINIGRNYDSKTRTIQLLENRNSGLLMGNAPCKHPFGSTALPIKMQDKILTTGHAVNVTPNGVNIIKLASEVN